jgi:hypothetical protein
MELRRVPCAWRIGDCAIHERAPRIGTGIASGCLLGTWSRLECPNTARASSSGSYFGFGGCW